MLKDLYRYNHVFPLGVLSWGTSQSNHFLFGIVVQELLFENKTYQRTINDGKHMIPTILINSRLGFIESVHEN